MKRNTLSTIFIIVVICCFINKTEAQELDNEVYPNYESVWHHEDLETNGVVGISLEKAYEFLKKTGRKSTSIVVAIVDSGIDTSHVDLKENLWNNPGEIPANEKDDDGNGYVDDYYGWNFLGNSKGENVNGDTWELTRYYSILKKEFDGKTKKQIQKNQKEEYETWLKVKEDYEAQKLEQQQEVEYLAKMVTLYEIVSEILAKHLAKQDFTLEDVLAIETKNDTLAEAKRIFSNYASRGMELSEMKSWLKNSKSELDTKLNPLFFARENMGDNLNSMEDSIYGNPDVMAETPGHGTSVGGTVGAVRNNGIGVNGIADNVKLMAVRVVPGGDERDKDVAMGIRYAVNNGAKIINGSFGKDFSPNKKFVDDAVKYAESKNVLIVHAAGNDGKDIDLGNNFPCPVYLDNGKRASNWIEVGASSRTNNENLNADFSNFGVKTVDVFAPGVDIMSTKPGSKFGESSGTSLASPVVAGVAALVWSYYPELTAVELKKIIEDSSVKFPGLKVNILNAKGKYVTIDFAKISRTGGVLNAYEAVKMADEFVKNKK
ncbi:MAG: S8 family serine peptidase [Bacteroidales bacterium]|nr:S8 family serine peptidase [Bacteroidales bacterium]